MNKVRPRRLQKKLDLPPKPLTPQDSQTGSAKKNNLKEKPKPTISTTQQVNSTQEKNNFSLEPEQEKNGHNTKKRQHKNSLEASRPLLTPSQDFYLFIIIYYLSPCYQLARSRSFLATLVNPPIAVANRRLLTLSIHRLLRLETAKSSHRCGVMCHMWSSSIIWWRLGPRRGWSPPLILKLGPITGPSVWHLD